MAQDGGQERTEQATPKRLREAREKGLVARSRELSTFLMMAACGGGLQFLGGGIVTAIMEIMTKNFQFTNGPWRDPNLLPAAFLDAVYAGLWSLTPLLVLLFVVALLVPAAVGGWIFSLEAVAFKWDKLDPIKGIGKLFSWRSALELFKAILKFVLVSAAIGAWLWFVFLFFVGFGVFSFFVCFVVFGCLLVWGLLF